MSPQRKTIRVTFGDTPDAMQMIRQDDRRINLERMFTFDFGDRDPRQKHDRLIAGRHDALQIDRKKPSGSGMLQAAIFCHGFLL